MDVGSTEGAEMLQMRHEDGAVRMEEGVLLEFSVKPQEGIEIQYHKVYS